MENYDNLLKSELVALCEKRGLATDGLKEDLKQRLLVDDASKQVEATPVKKVVKQEKKKVWNPQLFRYEYK